MENSSDLWIFLSPLRALAEEFYNRTSSIPFLTAHIIRNKGDWQKVSSPSKVRPTLILSTPESLAIEKLEQLSQDKTCKVIVDEFHLFYLWGHSFRPILWKTLIDLGGYNFSFLALSATINDAIRKEWRRDFSLSFDHLFAIDVGNQIFKNPPQKIHYFTLWGRRGLERRFLFHLFSTPKKPSTILYFCKYREQVSAWIKFCRRRGITALGCKGGEALEFVQELKRQKESPRVIFATSTLGHGVNLPAIGKVFISYPVKSGDLWFQMAGRGGRKGEPYQVYTLNFHHFSFKRGTLSLLANGIKNIFLFFYLWIKML